MRACVTLGLIGCSIFSASARAAEPLQPTGKWFVDFAGTQCIASRDYGRPGSQILLIFKEPALGDAIQMTVTKQGTGGAYAEEVDGHLSLDDGSRIPVSMVVIGVKQFGNVIFRMNIPRPLFNRIASSSSLHFNGGYRFSESFALRAMPDVAKLLDQCANDLRKVWHVSDAVDESNSGERATTSSAGPQRPLKGSVRGLITSDDYPGVALSGNESGAVQFALLVDEKGKVADCSVVQTSGVAALDSQSCAIVQRRAQFSPAIGGDGRPTKSSALARITWRISN